jgi:WD40 repeat protein
LFLTFQKNGSHWVLACDFAPDGKTIVSASLDAGKTIVSASWDQTLKIWDVESGKCQTTLKGHRYLCLFCAIAVGKNR